VEQRATAAQAQQLWRAGQREEAQRLCERLAAGAEEQEWQRAEALSLLAEMQEAAGRGAQALTSLARLVELQPLQAAVWRRLGNAQLAAGQAQAAQVSYERSIEIEPGNVRSYNNLGQALMRLGRRAEAIACYEQALRLDASYAPGHNNLGLALYEQGQFERALQCYRRALELDGRLVEAYCNSGNALLRLGQREQALASYERGLALQADHLGLLCNAANVLLVLRRPQQGLAYAERAVAHHAHSAEAHNNRAGALRQLHRYPEAQAACEQALALKADYAEALANLGSVWLSLNRPLEALACCDRAMALRPQLPEAHYNRGAALLALRRAPEAAQAYERLLQLAPDYKDALGALINARALSCDWRQYDQLIGQLRERVLNGEPVTRPFAFLACSASALEQRLCASSFAADETVPDRSLAAGWPYRHRRIRIAYLSDDLHDHPVGYLLAGALECHDRERFESIALSFRPAGPSEFARRVAAAFDRFVDVSQLDDRQVAQLMHELQIDIAVDLMGHTQGKRSAILAHRAAPVQVNYLGFPGTMGAGYIDYIVADEFVIPPALRQHYVEQVAYLPQCFQANDDRRVIGAVPTRAQAGLPEGALVLCCFNSSNKINPAMFDVWCRLLAEVPHSVLWLLAEGDQAAGNLRREAAARGLDPGRLIMAPRLSYPQHLGRLALADLFLDTLPFNAGASASDALWGGVPVLTCAGEAFAARMAGSLLRAVGLHELITHNLPEYERRGLALAREPGALRQLRDRLATHRHSAPLFDTRRFCRHLEAAYHTMWERAERGQAPTSFVLSP
jgi:predicted O-linked N-acetylglucosamine transferase (SPINDLY family)